MTNPFKTSRTRRVPGVRQLDSGRWQARYTDPAGMTRTLGTFDTFDEAKNARARVDTAVADGIYRDPVLGVESLGDYLARWFDRRAVQVASGTLAAGTLQTYRDSARIYITAALPGPAGRGRGIDLGALPLRSLSVTIVTDWYAQVLAYAAQRVNAEAMARAARRVPSDTTAARTWARSAGIKVPAAGRLSPRVIAAWRAAGAPKARPVPEIVARPGATAAATAYRLLRTVLNDALRENLILANPCVIRGAGSTNPDERVIATLDEIATITAAMPPRFAAAIPVAMWGALRLGELAGLQRGDVRIMRDAGGQVTGATIRIARAAHRERGKGVVFGPTKTKGSRRTTHLPRVAAVALADHMEAFTGPTATALVFTGGNGAPLVSGGHFATVWHRARAAAGRPDLHLHDLRHTGLTLAAQVPGATLRALQDRAGHSTSRAALLYQHAVTGPTRPSPPD